MKVERIWRLGEALRDSNGYSIIGPVLLSILSIKYLEERHVNKMDEKATLSYLIKDSSNTVENLIESFSLVEETFPTLKGVYESLGVNWKSLDAKMMFEVVMTVHKDDTTNYLDMMFVLRDLIMKAVGKSGNGDMTPNSLNELLISLLDIQDESSFYDGSAGNGGTLLEVVKQHPGKEITLFGQEVNTKSWASAKLTLLLAGAENVNFVLGDTLTKPHFIEENRVKRFDYIAMAPPFSLKLGDMQHNKLMQDSLNRFSLGDLPKTSADMAFILHALSSMSDKGRATLLINDGVLFRGGMEKSIRQNLIDTDQIEAVISLAPNLLTTTSIPINILVLNKKKPSSKRNKIQFIQASELYEEKNRVRFLKKEHIQRIQSTLDSGEEIDGFSKLVALDEVEDSLNISRYIQDKEIVLENQGVYKIHLDRLSSEDTDLIEIEKFADVYRGLNITSKTGEESPVGEYRLIKLSDVNAGEILWDTLKHVEMKTNFKSGMYQVREGDVIISSRGNNIKVAVIPPHDDKVLLSQNFLGIRFTTNNVDPAFLQIYFESPLGQYQLANLMKGTTVLSLNPKSLSSLRIAVPSIENQKATVMQYKEAEESYERQVREAQEKLSNEKKEVYSRMGILDSFELLEPEN